MQLQLRDEMKFRGSKKSCLRIDREYWMHECGLMEMPDRKKGVHFRIPLEGGEGMMRLGKVLEERELLIRCLATGTRWEGSLYGIRA
jgi:hypothetical protein